MSEYLTMEEIKKRYPDEWVLLEDPETDEFSAVVAGTLLEHGKDQESVAKRVKDKCFSSSAFLFTGDPDPNVVYLL